MSETPTLRLISTGKTFKGKLCEMVDSTQMFGYFDWHHIEDLCDYLEAYEADEGVVLFREGEPGNYMCLIIDGSVDILKEDSQETNKSVSIVGRGKTLGEMSIIDGQPRSATAVVAEPTTLAILTKANFQRLIQEKPALAAQIMLRIASLLSQRLRVTSGVLVDYLDN
ncbi:MAG: cyclic nucleotide-binding domain-containing protein [Burkholderiales bacterium]|nr:cyclic nucleotide-binding domain-containing protein [Burkholderiales bacterium]